MPDDVRLLLTRPLAQAEDWSGRLAAFGVPTLALPLIDIVPGADAAAVRAAWAELPHLHLVMFVSPNAVRHFFEHRPTGQTWPATVWAATVGPGSAQALIDAGVPAGRIVQPPSDADMLDSEHLWPEIQRQGGTDWRGRAALLVRGDGGREWLGDRLREAGAAVRAVSVYRRQCPVLDDRSSALLRAALDRPGGFVWLFSSSEAIGHLETLVASLESGTGGPGPADRPEGVSWAGLQAIATHERIAARARALGLIHVVLVRPDAGAVAEAFRRLSGSPLESPS